MSGRKGRVHGAQLSQSEREILVGARQCRQPPDPRCRLLAPIVMKRGVRDIQFPRSGDTDGVDHGDRAAVLEDVRRLQIAVQCNNRSPFCLSNSRPSVCKEGTCETADFDARTPVSESSPAGARGPVSASRSSANRAGASPTVVPDGRVPGATHLVGERVRGSLDARPRRASRSSRQTGAPRWRTASVPPRGRSGMTPRHDSPRACGHPLIVE